MARSMRLREAYQRKPRSTMLRPSHLKCSRTKVARCSALNSGMQASRLRVAMCRRSRARACSKAPVPAPSADCHDSGKKLTNHNNPMAKRAPITDPSLVHHFLGAL
jgi:hypothetical protein